MNNDLRDGLAQLTTYAAFIATGLPGVTFFTNNAPPMFEAVAVLAMGFSAGVVLYGFVNAPSKTKIPGRAVSYMVAAIIALTSYGWLQQYTTATPPGESSPRIQIGFSMQRWSLSEDARNLLKKQEVEAQVAQEMNTPQHLLMAYGVWAKENTPDKIWLWWSRLLAGLILIVLFLTGFSAWSYACGILSKYFSLLSKEAAKKKASESSVVEGET